MNSSALRFHPLHGTNAVITNGSRTAKRKHDFRDAIVMSNRCLRDGELFEVVIQEMEKSWSGSIRAGVTAIRPEQLKFPKSMTGMDQRTWMLNRSDITQNGNTVHKNYCCSLDSLSTGSRIGVMCSTSRDLHFYINGVDQGVACTGLPTEVYAVIDLYGQCVQVSITSCCQGCQKRPWHRTITAVPHPSLQDNISQRLRVMPLSSSSLFPWSNVLNNLHFHQLHGTNAVITNGSRTAKREHGFCDAIVMSNRCLRDGELFEVMIQEMVDRWGGSVKAGVTVIKPEDMKFPNTLTDMHSGIWMLPQCDIDYLPTGSRIGMMRSTNGDLHYYFNGVNQGVACTDLPSEVYAVIDLYGKCVQVSITNCSQGCWHLPWDSNFTADSSPLRANSLNALRFHQLHGTNAIITSDGQTAQQRDQSHSSGNAIVMSNRCLQNGELFEFVIQKMAGYLLGTVQAGVTAIRPETLTFPETMSDMDSDIWMLPECDLDLLSNGSKIGMMRSADGDLHYYFDGVNQGVACTDLPSDVYVMIDLHRCAQVSITDCRQCELNVTGVPVPEELSVDSVTTTSAHLSWRMPDVMNQTPYSFLISYHIEGTDPLQLTTDSCSAVITGLKPHNKYIVNVFTKTQNEEQSQPLTKTIHTVTIEAIDKVCLQLLQVDIPGKVASDLVSQLEHMCLTSGNHCLSREGEMISQLMAAMARQSGTKLPLDFIRSFTWAVECRDTASSTSVWFQEHVERVTAADLKDAVRDRRQRKKVLDAIRKNTKILSEVVANIRSLDKYSTCMSNKGRNIIDYFLRICKDPSVAVWLNNKAQQVSFLNLLTFFYQSLSERLNEEMQKRRPIEHVHIVFVAHGRITDTLMPALALLPPSITDTILYSPWNCLIDANVVYGIATGLLEPHDVYFQDRSWPTEQRYDVVVEKWNHLRTSASSLIPEIILGPIYDGDPECEDAWNDFKKLAPEGRGLWIEDRIFLPYCCEVRGALGEVPFAVLTTAASFILETMQKPTRATIHLAACLGRNSSPPRESEWQEQYFYMPDNTIMSTDKFQNIARPTDRALHNVLSVIFHSNRRPQR